MEHATLGAVIMAAGNAVRFGENKLLRLCDGKPMAAYIMEIMAAFSDIKTLVVTQYPALCALAEGYQLPCCINPDPGAGVSGTIRLGLNTLLHTYPDLSGCLFAVADQPYLTRESVLGLIFLWQQDKNRIAALACEGKRGNPVIFPKHCFPELLALSGDVGGSRVIRAHPEALSLHSVSDPRELMDIDTTADLL